MFEEIQKTLSSPLQFAAQDNYAHIGKLKNFSALVKKTLEGNVDGLSSILKTRLLELANDFDKLENRLRIPVIIEFQQLLDKREIYVDPLNAPVSVLPQIGPKKAQLLNANHIITVRDLLNFLPRCYIDRQKMYSLSALQEGQTAVVCANVMRSQFWGRGRGKRLDVLLQNETGFLKLLFFNASGFHAFAQLSIGAQITVLGKISQNTKIPTMVHPRIFVGEKTENLVGIWPVYSEIAGISATEIGRMMQTALAYLAERPPLDPLPSELLRTARLQNLSDTYKTIHAPSTLSIQQSVEKLNLRSNLAYRRIAFDEIFAFQLRLQLTQRHQQAFNSPYLSQINTTQFMSQLLPFQPTKAQERVFGEIAADMGRKNPMARLLQGDVGAGKTAVAITAAFHVIQNGYQCAVMAPTEILAKQHFRNIQQLLAQHHIKVALLTGSTSIENKRSIARELREGEVQLIIGTHAIISEDIEFSKLGLCIIDEQHRFGVEQRAALRLKGEKSGLTPHLLVMTATPIPRSLALTLYGDLALSILDELPPGRKSVPTKIIRGNITTSAIQIAQRFINEGQKIYVIYPLVEESEKLDLIDATSNYQIFCEHFGVNTCALLHGRLKSKEKELAIQQFAQGDVKILLSTTVVEVGVDIPDATCMVIIHAERFGLSQLHQLRGRVGRNHMQSHCFLITQCPKANDDISHRLQIMEETNDGFRIANADLEIRGPGDFLGTKQSGLPLFSFYDLTKHSDLIEPARNLAIQIIERDPTLSNPLYAHHKTISASAERS